jgi:hypothetical protein
MPEPRPAGAADPVDRRPALTSGRLTGEGRSSFRRGRPRWRRLTLVARGHPRWRRLILVVASLALASCASAVDSHVDARIEAEVKARLVAEKTANLTRLGVVSRGATVYLSGAVETPEHRELAESLARDVRGVKGVVDRLAVNPTPLERR